MARSPAGRPAATGAGRPRRRQRAARGSRRDSRSRLEQRLAHRRLDGQVEAAPLAARADEHVAVERGLHDGAHQEPRPLALHRRHVRAVDHLVAQEARAALEPDELALARLDRQLEPRAAASGALHAPAAITTASAAMRAPAAAMPSTRPPRTATASTGQPVSTAAPSASASRARPRAIARGSHWRSRGNEAAQQLAAQLRLRLPRLGGIEQRALDPRGAQLGHPLGLFLPRVAPVCTTSAPLRLIPASAPSSSSISS